MAVKYSKAPISELIFGIIFNSGFLSKKGMIFDLINELTKGDYPTLVTQPAIFEEDWADNRISVNMDYEKAGFSLYRLYSKDGYYMVQLQKNCILINWIRKDDIAVGKYPGFTEVHNRFNKIITWIKERIEKEVELKDLDFLKQIKNLSLTYHDRVSIESSSDAEPLKKFLNLSFPKVPIGDTELYPSSIISKFIVPCPQINGFDAVSINTGQDQQGKRILAIENRIKGGLISNDLDDWFKSAHKIQVDFFANLFTKEVLTSWQ